MKLLLTSGGVENASIHDALVRLLSKPGEVADALYIPTAQWGHPWCGPATARRFVAGEGVSRTIDLGWRSVGFLELTALPSMRSDRWVSWVTDADVLLVDGGAADYLAHWMRESGLAELLPTLDTVWVGFSAGSMVMTPRIGDDFLACQASGGDDRGLGVVDFSIFPHLGMQPDNLLPAAVRWAAGLGNPSYAIDDQTAIVVADGSVEVVSEGEWHSFPG